MESDERPSKMRKLEHEDNTNEQTADPAPEDALGKEHNVAAEKGENEDAGDDAAEVGGEGEGPEPKLSKNQLKKQRRLERWEAGREDRKAKRREKIKAKKERRREEWAQNNANGETKELPRIRAGKCAPKGTQVPVTIIFDCDFEDLMFDNELKSLGLQITRSYSDNRKAAYRAHLAVSSFGESSKLKERFDGILAKQYTSWEGVRFFSEDFVHVAEQAKEWMKGPQGGEVAGALEPDKGAQSDGEEEGEVVYLSAESDNTLERLKPNSTYIIGGLVDKNRHKGLCYKRALDRGIKTAKLPIGEFLKMKSRQVLVTNHVLDIMLKWMEFGDWGKAFMEVLPKRKGGVLKSEAEEGDGEDQATSPGAGDDGEEALEMDEETETRPTGESNNAAMVA
ncbi:hypothetical protein BS50DRAFT_577280 [Corynespora cassiicola Philippines]|uniref:tRNA (guanine(9)-N1)-methyltransferase n=1 Tax=Corynespora cassiicola Philippines TaxID=1448308 RepID=A0A2T2NAA1_CORCC|nr:hypothetical protein BS50DRAFT_577280 [Corynespora cassiicola Philippines]